MAGRGIFTVAVLILVAHFAKSENTDLDLVLSRFNNMQMEITRLTQRVNDLEKKDETQTKTIVHLESELGLLRRQNSDLHRQQTESQIGIRSLEDSVELLRRNEETDDVVQNGLNRDIPVQYNDSQYTVIDSSLLDQGVDAEGLDHVIKAAEPVLEAPKPPRRRNGRSFPESQVAFTAKIGPHDYGPLGKDQIIVFANVLTNVGNAYHSHNGVFTAPVSGVYVFSVTVAGWHHSYDGQIYVTVKVNSNVVGTLWIGEIDQSSQLFILSLNQNDDFYAINAEASVTLLGGTYSSFSGFLLY